MAAPSEAPSGDIHHESLDRGQVDPSIDRLPFANDDTERTCAIGASDHFFISERDTVSSVRQLVEKLSMKLFANCSVCQRRTKVTKFICVISQIEQLRSKTLVVNIFPSIGPEHVATCIRRSDIERKTRRVEGVVQLAKNG